MPGQAGGVKTTLPAVPDELVPESMVNPTSGSESPVIRVARVIDCHRTPTAAAAAATLGLAGVGGWRLAEDAVSEIQRASARADANRYAFNVGAEGDVIARDPNGPYAPDPSALSEFVISKPGPSKVGGQSIDVDVARLGPSQISGLESNDALRITMKDADGKLLSPKSGWFVERATVVGRESKEIVADARSGETPKAASESVKLNSSRQLMLVPIYEQLDEGEYSLRIILRNGRNQERYEIATGMTVRAASRQVFRAGQEEASVVTRQVQYADGWVGIDATASGGYARVHLRPVDEDADSWVEAKTETPLSMSDTVASGFTRRVSPTDDSPVELVIRAHELGRVNGSPARLSEFLMTVPPSTETTVPVHQHGSSNPAHIPEPGPSLGG